MYGDRSAGRDGEAEDAVAETFSLAGLRDPARVIELAYLSQEPGLLEIIRAIACLPVATRAVLQAFLSAAPDVGQVSAARHHGELVLSPLSVAAAGAAADKRRAD
jgi:hypothetical protein